MFGLNEQYAWKEVIFMSLAIEAIRPQSGPQEIFLSANTRLGFYGGAAGGG
jgi:hypothetical protein